MKFRCSQMSIIKNCGIEYQRLTKNLQLMKQRAGEVGNRFKLLAQYPEVCIEHGFINYMVASSGVPLMEEALRCAKLLPEDIVCQQLIGYLKRHIAEEADHDTWFLDDMEAIGIDREEIKNRMPPPNVAAMVGSQYYWLRHHHPIAILGYLACLEINHPTVEYVESLIKSSGLPAKGFDTFMEHAKVDVHHKQDIIDMINSLPLTKAQYRIMEISAFQTYRYVALVMEEVCNVAPVEKIA